MNSAQINRTLSNQARNRAVLVDLTISRFKPTRKARNISEAVCQKAGASDLRAFSGHIRLAPHEAFAEVTSAETDLRAALYRRTSPFFDKGPRLCGNDQFLPLKQDIDRGIDRFTRAAADIVALWPSIEAAAADRMGTLRSEVDFPTQDDIRRKFSVRFDVMPVPDTFDIRLDMTDAEADMTLSTILSDAEQALAERVTSAPRAECLRRALKVTEAMSEALERYQPATDTDRAKGGFHATLVTNIAELVETLPGLNIFDDPDIAALADRLNRLTLSDAPALKDDDNLRATVIADATALRSDISDLMD